MAEFVTHDHPKLSYSAKVPSNASSISNLNGRAVLLVGPDCWTQPLSSALLQVQFDRHPVAEKTLTTTNHRTTNNNNVNSAVEALRRHCCYDPPKRLIHTVESLENASWNFRMDHIVLLSPAPAYATLCLPSDQPSDMFHQHDSIHRLLHEDYILYQRVTKVHVHELGRVMNTDKNWTMEQNRNMMHMMPTVLNVYLDSPSSLATVARMIWQRTKVGTRQGTPVLPHVSPLLFGP